MIDVIFYYFQHLVVAIVYCYFSSTFTFKHCGLHSCHPC